MVLVKNDVCIIYLYHRRDPSFWLSPFTYEAMVWNIEL